MERQQAAVPEATANVVPASSGAEEGTGKAMSVVFGDGAPHCGTCGGPVREWKDAVGGLLFRAEPDAELAALREVEAAARNRCDDASAGWAPELRAALARLDALRGQR